MNEEKCVKTTSIKIQNYTLEQCLEIFGKKEIQIQDYVLMVMGKMQGNLHVGFLKIIQKENDASYLIGLYHANDLQNYVCIQVSSLTSMRQEIFGFEDHLSFERSTYILTDTFCFVRLKCVRSMITMMQCNHNHNHNNNKKMKKLKTITSRTQSQLKKCLQQVYTSYVRDLQNEYSKEMIFQLFEHDIQEYLTSLKLII